jgi:hypothetical protein
MTTAPFVCLSALLATAGIQHEGRAQNPDSRAPTGKVEMFKFEQVEHPDPNAVTPRKWNWEVQLSAAQSQSHFRIVQHTVGKKGSGPGTDDVLFDEKALQKSSGDIIHFRLHTGDDHPTLDMNKKGNIGLGVSFARVGGGYGSSNWIVMPGKIVQSHVSKQDYFTNGLLPLVSFETVDALGNEFRTEVRLEASKSPQSR